MTIADEHLARLTALVAAQPPGKRVQFHPYHAPEADGTKCTEWDTSHDVSRIGPDGTRYRIATYRHADDAAFADEACNALPELIDALAAERTARLAAEEQWNAEIVRWEACYDGERDRANAELARAEAAEAALAAKDAEIARMRGALAVIADGKVPSYTSYQQWHDKYVACGIFARAALKEDTP